MRRQSGREAPRRTAAGVRQAAIFSLVVPFVAVAAGFLVARFVTDRRTASALGLLCLLLVLAGFLAGGWAWLESVSYRVRAGRGLAQAGFCLSGLFILLLLVMRDPRSTSRSGPPRAAQLWRESSLAGMVLRKEWTKSLESWKATGSEYYVLQVEGRGIPYTAQSAREGVILRSSDTVSFASFSNFVGRRVTCRGVFVQGEPYIPQSDGAGQRPLPAISRAGETENLAIGAGFKVSAIELIEKE